MLADKIPLVREWGDLSDGNVQESFDFFSGKSNSDFREEYKNNFIELCWYLRWMPILPFKYYIFGLLQHIWDGEFEEDERVHVYRCFVELVGRRSLSHPADMKSIYKFIRPVLKEISDQYEQNVSDLDLYGSLSEKVEYIDSMLSAR